MIGNFELKVMDKMGRKLIEHENTYLYKNTYLYENIYLYKGISDQCTQRA